MEPTVSAPATAATHTTTPVAHTTIRPLPRHSVLIAFLVAALIPALLLALVITIMLSANYNFLNWME